MSGSRSPSRSPSPRRGSESPPPRRASSRSPSPEKNALIPEQPARSPARSPARAPAGSPAQSRSRSRSRSPAPKRGRSPARSPSPRRRTRSPSRERDTAKNPGNNLYVSGLSTRVTEQDLEEHFKKEGKVQDCRLVVDPRTQLSRGFAFVTMVDDRDADRAVRYLDKSTLLGRIITVEKAKRARARTPTPGNYLGVRGAVDYGYFSSTHSFRRCPDLASPLGMLVE
eukprot:jgi/Mesvir1/2273/Mv19314-RA.1